MKRILLPIILVAVLAVGGYFVFFYGQGGADSSDSGEGSELAEGGQGSEMAEELPPSPEEIARQQRLIERARPMEFVDMRYTSRRNLLMETIIEGTLENNAELTAYKDLQLMIYFVDEEGKKLDSASQVIFETLSPGAKVPFKLKEKGPRKADVRLDLLDANALDK